MSKYNCVVVCKQEICREIVKKYLKKNNVKITCFGNINDVIKHNKNNYIDTILVDADDMDEFTWVDKLRKKLQVRDIICITSYADNYNIKKFKKYGFDLAIIKPITKNVVNAVKNAITQKISNIRQRYLPKSCILNKN